MPANTLVDLFNFEALIEDDAKSYLEQNIITPAAQMITVASTDELQVPRIEIKAEMGPALDGLQLVANAGGDLKEYIDYQMNLIFMILTDNNKNTQAQHRSLVNQVRALYTRNGTAMNTLTFYEPRLLRPGSTSHQADGDFNLTTLIYDAIISIKPDQWPI
jgi:hypothetical protein